MRIIPSTRPPVDPWDPPPSFEQIARARLGQAIESGDIADAEVSEWILPDGQDLLSRDSVDQLATYQRSQFSRDGRQYTAYVVPNQEGEPQLLFKERTVLRSMPRPTVREVYFNLGPAIVMPAFPHPLG
jgi:hypothetical protein